MLGNLYENGLGVETDLRRAYDELYLKAAELGSKQGLSNVGIALLIGRGVERNPFEAAKWNRRAAEKGHAQAQFNLGRQYLSGDGVPQDFQEAIYWISEAAKNGYERAIQIMEQINGMQ